MSDETSQAKIEGAVAYETGEDLQKFLPRSDKLSELETKVTKEKEEGFFERIGSALGLAQTERLQH